MGGNLKYMVVRKRDGPVGGKERKKFYFFFKKNLVTGMFKNISKSMAICQGSIEGVELNLNESNLITETITT